MANHIAYIKPVSSQKHLTVSDGASTEVTSSLGPKPGPSVFHRRNCGKGKTPWLGYSVALLNGHTARGLENISTHTHTQTSEVAQSHSYQHGRHTCVSCVCEDTKSTNQREDICNATIYLRVPQLTVHVRPTAVGSATMWISVRTDDAAIMHSFAIDRQCRNRV